MTYKEAIGFVHNLPKATKDFYIKMIGKEIFNSLVAMGSLTTNLGTYYWTTRLFKEYYEEFNSTIV